MYAEPNIEILYYLVGISFVFATDLLVYRTSYVLIHSSNGNFIPITSVDENVIINKK